MILPDAHDYLRAHLNLRAMDHQIKAIFLDLGETLVTQNIEDNLVTRSALEKISTLLPKPVSPVRLFRLYKEGYKVNQAIRTSHNVEIPIQVWMRQLLKRALGEEPLERVVDQAIDLTVEARSSNAVAFPEAHAVLGQLSKHRAKLGIISNVSSHDVALAILRKVGLRDYFRLVVTSASTGIRKPDPGIFRYGLMRFKIRPEEAVHVGDSERHDIEGGYSAGLRTVLITRDRHPVKTLADYQFRTLTEASPILQSLYQRRQ